MINFHVARFDGGPVDGVMRLGQGHDANPGFHVTLEDRYYRYVIISLDDSGPINIATYRYEESNV